MEKKEMSKRSSRIIELKNPNLLEICMAPRRRVHHHHHHSLSHREERKASFRGNWIKKEKCKVTLPSFKVNVIQPVNGIVDKLKGAWTRVKLMVSPSSSSKRTSRRKNTTTMQQQQGAGPGLYCHLSSYPEDAVADCIEFIKQSADVRHEP